MAEALLNEAKESKMQANIVQRETDGAASEIASLPDDIAKELVGFFKLFADETRMRILHFLMQRDEFNVRTLCELLGQSQPAVSHHLALLRVANLIECRRDGKHNFYRIVPERLQELVEMLFKVAPKEAGRIAFKTFSLSYRPVNETE